MPKESAGARSKASKARIAPRSDGAGRAIQNEILLALPRKERDLVLARLTLLDSKLGDKLQEAGAKIQFAYFPNSAMASILSLMEDGRGIEVGMAGREGFVGLPLLAGFRTSAHRIVTQCQGSTYRIPAAAMQETLRRCPALARALHRYSQKAAMQTTQIAACNRLHEVDQRLARWLLMTRDRFASDDLPLTQEFLGQMLGARRASVSVAASVLQKAGLIGYNRGRVKILNRRALERASCECYRVMKRQIGTWDRES